MGAIRDVLRTEDEGRQPETFVDGLENVLAEPEFARGDRVLGVLDAVDQRNLSLAIPFQNLLDGRVLVTIGGENRVESMRDFSLVVSRYGASETARGALGVVGPTRMRYSRVISTVRYMADVMSDLVAAVHGSEGDEEAGRP